MHAALLAQVPQADREAEKRGGWRGEGGRAAGAGVRRAAIRAQEPTVEGVEKVKTAGQGTTDSKKGQMMHAGGQCSET